MQLFQKQWRMLSVTGLVLAATLGISSAASAAGWIELASPTEKDLNGVDCGASTSCVAVGAGGTVLYTTDKITWTAGTSGTTNDLEDVDMVSSSTGFAVGFGGTIIKTTDGGATWTSLSSGTTEWLFDIHMASSTVGWTVGEDAAIRKTTNGSTWSSTLGSPSGASSDFRAVDAYSTSNVWIAGKSGTIHRSTTGGDSWTSIPVPVTSHIQSIEVLTGTSAIVGGDNGLLYKTTNSGTTWTSLGTPSGFSATDTIIDVQFWGTSSGNVIGNDGSGPANTADGGATWGEDNRSFGSIAHADIAAPASTVRYLVADAGFLALYDATGPSAPTNLSLDPASPTSDTTPTLSWSASTDGEGTVAYYEYSLDDGESWEPTNFSDSGFGIAVDEAPTTHIFNTLAAGDYTVLIRAVDEAGNAGSSASFTFTITSGEMTGPTVSKVTPTSAAVGVATTFSVTATDDDGTVAACTLIIDDTPIAMTAESSSTFTASYTFTSTGNYMSGAMCEDNAGNTGTSDLGMISVSATADSTAPTVGSVTPVTATEDSAVTLSASYSDAGTISGCKLYVNGSSDGYMTLASGTASQSYTFTSAGSYSAYVKCTDTAGNVGTGATTTVTVASTADTTAPTVGAVSPSTATEDVSTTMSATYSDAVGVTSCTLYVNGSSVGAMTLASGTASKAYTFASSTTYSAYVRCYDAAGNAGTSSTTTVTASTTTDTTAPSVSAVTPTSATEDVAKTFSVTYSDTVGVSSCTLYIDSASIGAMTLAGGTASKSYTFTASGSHGAYAKCTDPTGNVGTGSTTTVTVSVATDTTAPTVSTLTPTSVTEDVEVTISASVYDAGGIDFCKLYVDRTFIGYMDEGSGGMATYDHTFHSSGTSVANAYCVDDAGNATRGADTTITVAEPSDEASEAVDEAEEGNLLKLACPGGEDASHPCRAVYYYGEDGKRHAFPNERVFLTWFNDFEDVIIVTSDFMSSITLGRNVTYHPGVTMVKFISVNTVYAVGEEGELRAIDSEDTARSIFGTDWNQQIHDISDAFYGNYTFGEDIDSTSDYDPDDVYDAVNEIDDLL